jgi:hypothetical protein
MTNEKTLAETAAALGHEAKESIEELSRTTAETLDRAQDKTRGALHTAAASVRSTGRQGSEAIGQAATEAADRLDAGAAYLDEHDWRGVPTGVRKFAHRHLTGSLLAAAAIGFVAASAVRAMSRPCGRAIKGT